ncbi:MAG TPA: murein biosynthesis integral membrane protein MurJ [Chlamydiales bacterium]
MSDNTRSVLRSAKHFFLGTLLSRFSGFFRDVAMAFCFGSAPEVASFMVAYRLANLCRKLFGESNAQAGFTPHFEKARGEGDKAAFFFYRDAAWSMGVLILAVVLLIEVGLWFLRPHLPGEWQEVALLSMWMSPGLLFITLFGLHNALLQCQKKAFWPAAAPVAFNMAWIGAALLAANLPEAMRPLSLGITLAYGLQWFLTAFQVWRELGSFVSLKEWFQPRLFSLEWRSMFRAMMLGILGVGAVQINSALDALFSKIADPSGPAYLWYAIRLEQLPLALFGIALAGALLPPLARALRQESLDNYRTLLGDALRHSLALIIPCTFGLFALGESGLNLLYGHGDFSPADVLATKECLWGYALGLIPAVVVLLVAQGFYARKNFAVPTIASLASVAVNIALNSLLVFVFQWGAVSIALATSFSAWVNMAILLIFLRRSGAWSSSALPLSFLSRLTIACGLPAALAWCISWGEPMPRDLFSQIVQFGTQGAVYLGSVLTLSKLLRIEELFEVMRRRA